jgi:hypothetical protein
MERTWLLLIASLAILWTGCGGGSSSPKSTTAPATATAATNAGLEAIDCKRHRAYIPIAPGNPLSAQVAVLDLSVDPDTTDPRLPTIDLKHAGPTQEAAIAPKQGLVLVTSGSVAATGFLDAINESDGTPVTGSPFSLPIGSRPLPSDGIVFDARHNQALLSMTSTPITCPSGSSTACTGMALFNLTTHSFGPLMQFDGPVNNFGFDPSAQISLAPADQISPLVNGINAAGNVACTLNDGSLNDISADPEGAAVDPGTGIWVVGNLDDVTTTVINLAGATFSGTTPPCDLLEAGTPPSNSLNFDTGAGEFLAGVAINPVTHQAVLTSPRDNQIALLSLPKTRVKFISPSDLDAVSAILPTEPDGSQFQANILPYSVSIDTCHNRAYIVNADETFMVEINLTMMQKNPNAISTALPAGNCKGTSTTLACDNNRGVRFFPLPGV